MKKYGKYEKMPDGTRAKQPPVKSMLLQTYFTSLLCMVLCVTMFFGTSYAWFTSEVNNTANEIYIGTLDVGLLAGDKDLSDSSNKLFDSNIRWEPGYTALETITVVNEGDLAFKYVLNFTDGMAKNADDTEAVLADVAKYFDVWVYDHRDNGGNAPAPASYAEIATANSGWVPAGSLDELLAGKTVLDGVMVTVRDDNTATPVNEGTTDGVATEDTYTIALHMKEDADVAVMGQRITLNVKLVAYQMASEQDDLGSKYDQMVATEDQLREALANGGTVALAADIKLTEGLTVASGKAVVLDLNGHTISQTVKSTSGQVMISNNGNLTITGNGTLILTDNGTVSGEAAYGSYTIRNAGTLVVENGTVELVRGEIDNASQVIFNYSGSTIINNGTITASKARSIRVWNGSVTINSGTFDGQVWAQPVNEDGCSLIINGGSFKPATNGNDASSIYVTNSTYDVALSVTGGSFATKIGCSDASKLAGCITGGEFTDVAKQNTASELFAS